MPDPLSAPAPSQFSAIETDKDRFRDLAYCVRRYGRAISAFARAYLLRELGNVPAAEDGAGRVLDAVLAKFAPKPDGRPSIQDRWDPQKGRFHKYLKRAVFAAAVDYLRKKAKVDRQTRPYDEVADPAERDDADDVFRAELVRHALARLEAAEAANPDSYCFTILQMKGDAPGASNEAPRARFEAHTGVPCHPDTFRRKLSDARRRFAECLRAEAMLVSRTDQFSVGEEYLRELGLYHYFDEHLADRE